MFCKLNVKQMYYNENHALDPTQSEEVKYFINDGVVTLFSEVYVTVIFQISVYYLHQPSYPLSH